MMKNYKNYQGKLPKSWGKKLLTILLVLILIGTLVFFVLLGLVLSGSRDDVNGEPQCMVILGCQVKPWGPSILLQDRINKAAGYLLAHPEVIAVASGAQGPDEPMSEAQAIRDGLVELGVETERIYMEEKSRNTSQNLTCSKAILEELGCEPEGNVIIVSNGFHLARVRMLAQRYGLGRVSTLAAPSSHTPSRLKMYIREPLALVKSFLFD